MSTRPLNKASSVNNTSRGRGRGRGRARGGGVPPPPQPPSGGLVGGNYIPPPLPIGIQRLIDGRTLQAVRVEYTPSGATVMAVPVQGPPVPLHEWKLRRETEQKRSALAERKKLLADRVSDRQGSFKGVVQFDADAIDSQVGCDEWLSSLEKEDRKLVLMTNKEFRALKGKNAEEASASVEASALSDAE